MITAPQLQAPAMASNLLSSRLVAPPGPQAPLPVGAVAVRGALRRGAARVAAAVVADGLLGTACDWQQAGDADAGHSRGGDGPLLHPGGVAAAGALATFGLGMAFGASLAMQRGRAARRFKPHGSGELQPAVHYTRPTQNLPSTPSAAKDTGTHPLAALRSRRASFIRRALATHPVQLQVHQPSERKADELSWAVPPNYDWEVCTHSNYASSSPHAAPTKLSAARALTDVGYHGIYTEERQRFQDAMVSSVVGEGPGRREPLLVFTAGAMGVGKSFVIRWMKEQGVLPSDEFVVIDPDCIAQRLPEYRGYFARAPSTAALQTRLEAGLITELSLVTALQLRQNLIVDSSLRHGGWYARLLERLRLVMPEVRIMLMYVHAPEETIHQRAEERGRGGRMVSNDEVRDSLYKMPDAVGKLLPHVDMFVQVANNGHVPRVTSICYPGGGSDDDQEDVEEEDDSQCCTVLDPEEAIYLHDLGWADVKCALSRARGEHAPAMPEPPRILPTSDVTELRPQFQLLRTMLFAATKHRHQARKDPQQTPYINHPLAVARTLAEVGIRDLPTLQAALLHDTIEDTATTSAEMRSVFGAEVCTLVESLTDDDALHPVVRKMAQLQTATSLPYKAKLVRIADKMDNVGDLLRHGIPGWSKQRIDKYVAWACEMVNALKGTHEALEERFHKEVTLPPGFELGDWQRLEAANPKCQVCHEYLDDMRCAGIVKRMSSASDEEAESEELSEHKALLTLISTAEFLCHHRRERSGEDVLAAMRCATLLASCGVRNTESLQAALLRGMLPHLQLADAGMSVVRGCLQERFGQEVANLVHNLSKVLPVIPLPQPHWLLPQQPKQRRSTSGSRVSGTSGGSNTLVRPVDVADTLACAHLPHKAKLVLLAEHVRHIQDIQEHGLREAEAENHFREDVQRAMAVREFLRGTHEELEAALDHVFQSQVRLASGELMPVCSVGSTLSSSGGGADRSMEL